MKHVSLGNDNYTIIDASDLEVVTQHRWRKHPSGYACRSTSIDGRRVTVWLHRMLMNAPPHLQVDHINGDRIDNRRSNLRLATKSENSRNVRSPDGLTGYKGVRARDGGRYYEASIRVGGTRHNLGKYPTAEEAYIAYVRGSRQYHGEFGNVECINMDKVITDEPTLLVDKSAG